MPEGLDTYVSIVSEAKVQIDVNLETSVLPHLARTIPEDLNTCVGSYVCSEVSAEHCTEFLTVSFLDLIWPFLYRAIFLISIVHLDFLFRQAWNILKMESIKISIDIKAVTPWSVRPTQ